jgi:hypothetical protein
MFRGKWLLEAEFHCKPMQTVTLEPNQWWLFICDGSRTLDSNSGIPCKKTPDYSAKLTPEITTSRQLKRGSLGGKQVPSFWTSFLAE